MDERCYPVYIIAHNPNTLDEADNVLAAGVNALEPDVQYNKFTKNLCISHDAPGKSDDPPSLEAYLEHVKLRLDDYPGLSLVLFDIKLDETEYNGISIADWGTDLHNTANRILGDTGLVMIYSVSKKEQVGIFADFAFSLGPKEAIMIDQETDVEEMISSLEPLITKGVTRIAYADGSYAYLPAPHIANSVRKALTRRAQTSLPNFVSTWVLPTENSVRQYLRMGVDGMIVHNDNIKAALQVVASPEFAGRLRLAEKTDNPFQNGMLNYGIDIQTLDRKLAGTDAVVNCVLSGPENAITSNIDTEHRRPFETGTTTPVALKMLLAGTPVSIYLTHDGTGVGAEWLPDIVHVYENKTGLDVYASFGEWIRKGEVYTRELGSFKYSLNVHTSDIASAGTDADILFTLDGTKGSVKRRINASPGGLFERNKHNIVEIPGMDIGEPLHLTVETDGSGNGADWHLDTIEILVNGAGTKTFVFNQWITGNKPVKK